MIRTLMPLALLAGLCGPAFGQAFHYPVLPEAAQSIDGFAVAGWTITDTANGDLNRDGLRDLALILEYSDSAIELLPPDTVGQWSIPRILVLAFRSGGGGYSLAAQNNFILLRNREFDNPGREGGAELSIDKKGRLHLRYQFFHGAVEYEYRYQKHDFYLIGYYQDGVAGGDLTTDDYNFLTRKHRSTSELIGGNRPSTSKIETITAPPLQSFKTFIRPGTWPVEDDDMGLEHHH